MEQIKERNSAQIEADIYNTWQYINRQRADMPGVDKSTSQKVTNQMENESLKKLPEQYQTQQVTDPNHRYETPNPYVELSKDDENYIENVSKKHRDEYLKNENGYYGNSNGSGDDGDDDWEHRHDNEKLEFVDEESGYTRSEAEARLNAINESLKDLKNIPPSQRTPEQQARYKELTEEQLYLQAVLTRLISKDHWAGNY